MVRGDMRTALSPFHNGDELAMARIRTQASCYRLRRSFLLAQQGLKFPSIWLACGGIAPSLQGPKLDRHPALHRSHCNRTETLAGRFRLTCSCPPDLGVRRLSVVT